MPEELIKPDSKGEGKRCFWSPSPSPPCPQDQSEVLGGGRASGTAILPPPAAPGCLALWPSVTFSCHWTWSRRRCWVQSKERRSGTLPQCTQLIAQTSAQLLAGGRDQMHVLMMLHLILPFSLTTPVTPVPAASSKRGLSTG